MIFLDPFEWWGDENVKSAASPKDAIRFILDEDEGEVKTEIIPVEVDLPLERGFAMEMGDCQVYVIELEPPFKVHRFQIKRRMIDS